VAKQHQTPYLDNRGKRWPISYLPHFMTVTPAYIKDPSKTPSIQCIDHFLGEQA